MPLYQDIENNIKDAMRSQQKDRLIALRNIKTFLKNKSIELKRDLNDQEVVQFLATLAKQRQESIESFESAGRQDLVDKEKAELAVIRTYMPEPLSDEALNDLIQKAIQEAEASGPKDMGKVMKLLKDKVTGRADGKIVSERVKAMLK